MKSNVFIGLIILPFVMLSSSCAFIEGIKHDRCEAAKNAAANPKKPAIATSTNQPTSGTKATTPATNQPTGQTTNQPAANVNQPATNTGTSTTEATPSSSVPTPSNTNPGATMIAPIVSP